MANMTWKFGARPARAKAALKRPHSKRSANDEALGVARQRLECGRFSAAFSPATLRDNSRPNL